MHKYLLDLKEALKQIERRYYFADVINDFTAETTTVEQQTENNFTSRLSFHLQTIMSREANLQVYRNLNLDFDLTKDIPDYRLLPNAKSVRPDLVLHESQAQWYVNQKLFIEVKTASYPKVENDVRKIINALSFLNFQFGIFISANSNFEDVKTRIEATINEIKNQHSEILSKTNLSNLYFFHLNNPTDRLVTVQNFAHV